VDFELSEEQRLLRETVREFAEAELAPHSREWDEKQAFPREVFLRLGALGLAGACWPEQYGGSGLTTLDWALVMEELARVDAGVALSLAAHHGLCSAHIHSFGSEPQKQRFLPPLASGQKVGCWGLTEPGSGSDAAGLATRARREGASWLLTGTKTFITQGTVADVFVVLARTDPEQRQKGITAFLLEKGWKGFTQRAIEGKLGMRSSDTAELHLDEVEVPDTHRIGEVGAGFTDTLQILDRGRVGIGALGVGLAQGAMEAARDYARQREAFGQPIASFQAVAFALADMATEIAAARLLVHRAAFLADSGVRFTCEASMAKLFASEVAARVTSRAVQIHGGYGYTADFPVERHFRDAKLCEIGEGTSEVQRMVIARAILR